MSFLRTTKTIFYFCFILLLAIKVALSDEKYSKNEIINNARLIKMGKSVFDAIYCYHLYTAKLEVAGFVTLHFKHNLEHTKSCPENVLYDVKVFN